MSGLVRPTDLSEYSAGGDGARTQWAQSITKPTITQLVGVKRSQIISTVCLRPQRSIEPKRLSWREKTPQGQSVGRTTKCQT